jgi:hypothetical protein
VEDNFNPYAEWLGIAHRGGRPNHYALLGLAAFESDTAAIVAAAERRMDVLAGIEPGARESLRQQVKSEVARARQVLTSAALKKQYDDLLRQKAAARSPAQLQPEAQTAANDKQSMRSRDPKTSADLLPPRAGEARPFPPGAPAAGDPMAPVMSIAPLDATPAVNPERAVQTLAADHSVGEISDQLATARMAARKLAVRRQKAPYWVLASTLVLLVVVGIALVVAYANGLIHIGPLPQVAERDASQSETPIVPSFGTASSDTAIDRTVSNVAPPTTNEVRPAVPEATAPAPQPTTDNSTVKPVDPPVDPEQTARFMAELAAARKSLGKRNMQAAKEHIDAAEKLAVTIEQKELFEGLRSLPKYVNGFWEAVREGLNGLEEAGELKVGNTYVSIVEVRAERLTILANKKHHRYPLDELPAGLAVAIARRWFDEKPENKIYVGAFYFVDPRTDRAEAKRLWEEASSAGVDAKRLLALLRIGDQ